MSVVHGPPRHDLSEAANCAPYLRYVCRHTPGPRFVCFIPALLRHLQDTRSGTTASIMGIGRRLDGAAKGRPSARQEVCALRLCRSPYGARRIHA